METKGLSSNWKLLQQELDKKKPRLEKRKVSEEEEASRPKRKKVSSNTSKEEHWQGEKADMSAAGDLALWAIENDIPTADLRQAYGNVPIWTRRKSDSALLAQEVLSVKSNENKINEGLSATAIPGKYIALDCEMVGTVLPPPDSVSALARVSLVTYHGSQLYDSYVRPTLPVTDWRTHVSGIRPSHMRHARDYECVRQEVAALLEGRVLVGHALKNDLEVLGLKHPRRDIRDTAGFVGFKKYAAGKTPALKKLCKEVLGLEVQVGEHSSVEDARAAMLLFRREKQAMEAEHAKKFSAAPVQLSAKEAAGEGKDADTVAAQKRAKERKKRLKKKKKVKVMAK